MYVALKLGALPFPIIFVALASMFFLKSLGKTNIKSLFIPDQNAVHRIRDFGNVK